MFSAWKRLLGAALLVSLFWAQLGFAQSGVAAAVEAPLTDAQFESLYLKEMDRQGEEFITKYKAQVSPEEREVGETAIRKSLQMFKLKWKQLHGLTETFGTLGKKAVVVATISELFTSFAVAPAMLALGHPGLALGVATFPFEPVELAAMAAYEFKKERIHLALSLRKDLRAAGVSLSDLDKFRHELLGFDLKNHLQSTIFEGVQDEIQQKFPVELVKKIKDRTKRLTGTIATGELEEIIRGQGKKGAAVLKQLYLDQAHPDLYATKLLAYVQEDPELSAKAISKAKEGLTLSADKLAMRAHVLDFYDAHKEVDYLQRELMSHRSELKDLMKSGANSVEAKQLRRDIDELSSVIREQSKQILELEYSYLVNLKTPGADLDAVTAASKKALQGVEAQLIANQKTFRTQQQCWEMLQAVARAARLF